MNTKKIESLWRELRKELANIRQLREDKREQLASLSFDFSCKTLKELRESGYNNTTDLSDVKFS
ncbi:MAG: hypothetical protein M3P08_04520 [Thermoproteota archaeon]|nr:hypothetical protein [Thermoproteota archaeon]